PATTSERLALSFASPSHGSAFARIAATQSTATAGRRIARHQAAASDRPPRGAALAAAATAAETTATAPTAGRSQTQSRAAPAANAAVAPVAAAAVARDVVGVGTALRAARPPATRGTARKPSTRRPPTI